MRQSINISADSIAAITNLNWLNESSLNQSKSDKKEKNITNDPTSLQKIMYEEWCMAKLRAKHAE